MTDDLQFVNSLTALVDNIQGGVFGNQGVQLSQTDTLFINNRWYLISNLRQLLSELYVEHGIVQTLVDQPVDDAFRGGFEIKTAQLDADEIEQLECYIKKNHVTESITQALKWTRLYGGGAVMIITDQPASTPLDLNRLNPESPIEFRAVDMWELYDNIMNVEDGDTTLNDSQAVYHYYGVPVHESRLYVMKGKQAPSFIRRRLRGWGMSELERLVRSLNQYMKNQDVVFDLLDEAKVDIYKMKGFNSALMTPTGTNGVAKRIQGANMIKNYNNALTMDTEDDYEQKQIAFTGLSEMLVQIRQGIAADLKMPVTKLFGISSAGFNSGEDDIENYNSMIESEIRAKVEFKVVDILGLVCKKLFGIVPDDLEIEFPPLRMLSAEQEQLVKDRKFNRVMSSLASGVISPVEAKSALNKDDLLPIYVEENEDMGQPIELVEDYGVTGAGGRTK